MAQKIIYFSGSKIADSFGVPVEELSIQGYLSGSPDFCPIALETEIDGFLFDFNLGLRLKIPAGNYHVKIFDAASNLLIFDRDISDVILVSLEKFFVDWEFSLYKDGAEIFNHRFNPAGRKVHFNFPKCGMGDRISLFPYMVAFRKKYNCAVTCTVEPYLQEIVSLYYPEVECVESAPVDSYATYFLAPGFNPAFVPEEIRKIPMVSMGEDILGLSLVGQNKITYRPTKPRQIAEPYVCIAVQASSTIKTWLNPNGWNFVVDYLKYLGYRVLCIDKNREQTDHGFTVRMPEGAEDFTGDIPLVERINLLAYADFFIGLSSGLSWLAWAADIPVILISGITAPFFEFPTPYRIVNRLVCFGCHNDTKIVWGEYENCPYHKNTDRAYECSRKISAQQVINAIDDLMKDKENNVGIGN